jgi:hypothetical protein
MAAARARLAGAKIALSVAALVAFAASMLLARATNAGGSGKKPSNSSASASSLSAPSSFLSALSRDDGSGGFDSGGSVAPAQGPGPPPVSSGGS